VWNCLTLALKYVRNSETSTSVTFPWITPDAIVPFSVKNDEAPGPICVSLFGANAVVLEATDGPNLIEQFRIVPPLRTG
jgi:hypothetical protein